MTKVNTEEFENSIRIYFDSMTSNDTENYVEQCVQYVIKFFDSFTKEEITNGLANDPYAFQVVEVLKTIKTTRAMTYKQFKLLNKFTKIAPIQLINESDIKRF